MKRKGLVILLICLQCSLFSPLGFAQSDNLNDKQGNLPDVTSSMTITVDEKLDLISIAADKASVSELLSSLAEKTGETIILTGRMPAEKLTLNIEKQSLEATLNTIAQAANCVWWLSGSDEPAEKHVYHVKYGYQRRQKVEMVKFSDNVCSIHIRQADLSEIEKILDLILKPTHTTVSAAQTGKSDITASVDDKSKVDATKISPILGSYTVDESQNDIIVYTTSPGTMDLVANIVKAYDKPVPVIKIKVVVVEISDGNSENSGVQWQNLLLSGIVTNNNVKGKLYTGTASTTITGRTATTSASTGAQVNYQTDNTVGKVKASAEVRVLNNQSVLISTGDQVPIFVVSTNGYPSVKMQDVMVSLKVKPSIMQFDKDIMKLDIESNVSSIESEQVEFGIAAPQLSTTTTKTIINVKNGVPFIVGEILRKETSTDKSSVPILGSIPIIKGLFSNKYHQDQSRKVGIFMLATVEEPVTEE
ncbi:MAG: hypothetical protein P4N59_11750 [Negativicutes bacterium]|nr:hypothetical protein [Negativicutes bacterium]